MPITLTMKVSYEFTIAFLLEHCIPKPAAFSCNEHQENSFHNHREKTLLADLAIFQSFTHQSLVTSENS